MNKTLFGILSLALVAGACGGGAQKTGAIGGAGGSEGGDSGGKFPGWYEAEAIPPNDKAPKSTISHGMACPSLPPKPGDNCQAGGGEVNWLTEGRQGWLQYNKVFAPSDGMYD